MWQNSKTQIATKLENSNCDKTKKIQIGKEKKTIIDKTKQKNSKTQIVTKLKNWNWDQTQQF